MLGRAFAFLLLLTVLLAGCPLPLGQTNALLRPSTGTSTPEFLVTESNQITQISKLQGASITWQLTDPCNNQPGVPTFPLAADRAQNGDVVVLCAAAGDSPAFLREFNPHGGLVWSYANTELMPYARTFRVVSSGNYLVSDPFTGYVTELQRGDNGSAYLLSKYLNVPDPPYDADLQPGIPTRMLVGSELRSYVVDRNSLKVISTVTFPGMGVQFLQNSNLLLVDNPIEGNPATQVSKYGVVVWTSTGVGSVWSAVRLPNGNTVIADGQAGRIVELDPSGQNTVWQFGGLKGPRMVRAVLPPACAQPGNSCVSSSECCIGLVCSKSVCVRPAK